MSTQLPGSDQTLVINGTYLLHEVTGSGSMSTVYKGVNLGTGDLVAVKIMKRNLLKDSDMVSRFEREIKTCSNLEHKNIVRVYDGGLLSTGEPYLAMEFLRGTNVADLLKANKTLNLERALNIIAQAADGLDAAHVRGYIHRDIKPQNIMVVSAAGKRDQVKVLDFGVAKVTGSLQRADMFSTAPGHVLGTPQYMSPEQIRGEQLDARSDIYGLGCVLYECLAGVPPIGGDNAIAVMRNHLAEPVPHLNSKAPMKYPEEVNAAIQKAVAKLPVDRHSTMAIFAADLRKLMKNPSAGGGGTNIMDGLLSILKKR